MEPTTHAAPSDWAHGRQREYSFSQTAASEPVRWKPFNARPNHNQESLMNPLSITRHAQALIVAGAALTLAACASAPEPKEQLAVANSSVEQATGNAAEAPAELTTARDKLARANVAVARKDFALARRLADEAAADAALAQATARTARSSRALAEVRESIQQLQTQLNRS